MSRVDIDAVIAADEARTAARRSGARRPKRCGAWSPADAQIAARNRLSMLESRIIEIRLFLAEGNESVWPQADADDRGEAAIGWWLERCQDAAVSGRLKASDADRLDTELPGWRQAVLCRA